MTTFAAAPAAARSTAATAARQVTALPPQSAVIPRSAPQDPDAPSGVTVPPVYVWAAPRLDPEALALARRVGTLTVRLNYGSPAAALNAAAAAVVGGLDLVAQYSPMSAPDDLLLLLRRAGEFSERDCRRVRCVLLDAELHDFRRLSGGARDLAADFQRVRYHVLSRLFGGASIAAYRYLTWYHWRGDECVEPDGFPPRAAPSLRLYHAPDRNRAYLDTLLFARPDQQLSVWVSAPGGAAYLERLAPQLAEPFCFAGASHPQAADITTYAAETGRMLREHAARIKEICIYPHPGDPRNDGRGYDCFDAFWSALHGASATAAETVTEGG